MPRDAATADFEAVVASLCLEHRLLSLRDAAQCIRDARRNRSNPLTLVLERKLAPVANLLAAVAQELDVEYADLFATDRPYRTSRILIDPSAVPWFERYCALPLLDAADRVVVACTDPTDPDLESYLSTLFPDEFRLLLAPEEQIRSLLAAEATDPLAGSVVYNEEEDADPYEELVTPPPSVGPRNPVIEWLDAALEAAVTQGASDLHFELGYDRHLMVRFRIDGELVRQAMPLRGRESEVVGALMNRVGMDTANQREPQDGSFAFSVAGRRIDVRAAMIPCETGPKVVLRLLDPRNLRSLSELGFGDESLDLMQRALRVSQGLVVVTGPTGAGKTTTLYGMVVDLAGADRNIMTVENPVEYRISYVSQIPVRADLGTRSVTFARALRTILRLDPDVILVGEVRDAETAKVALDASLTGHLVLTTIHAPSALGIATRFVEMGAPAYLVSEAISLSISQRLVRRLHSCRRMAEPTAAERDALEEIGYEVPEAVGTPIGCPACGGKGYRGRVAVAELLTPTAEVRAAIAARSPMVEIEALLARSPGYVPMTVDGQRLLDAGAVSALEVVKAAAAPEL